MASFVNELKRAEIINQAGTVVNLDTLAGKRIGLYFSAHWCPPCRGFTPRLVEFYNQMKAAGEALEIIFVSSDSDENSFKAYFAEMGWLAVQFDDSNIDDLKTKANVSGIPKLVILNTDLTLCSDNGRGEVMGFLEDKNRPKWL